MQALGLQWPRLSRGVSQTRVWLPCLGPRSEGLRFGDNHTLASPTSPSSKSVTGGSSGWWGMARWGRQSFPDILWAWEAPSQSLLPCGHLVPNISQRGARAEEG